MKNTIKSNLTRKTMLKVIPMLVLVLIYIFVPTEYRDDALRIYNLVMKAINAVFAEDLEGGIE